MASGAKGVVPRGSVVWRCGDVEETMVRMGRDVGPGETVPEISGLGCKRALATINVLVFKVPQNLLSLTMTRRLQWRRRVVVKSLGVASSAFRPVLYLRERMKKEEEDAFLTWEIEWSAFGEIWGKEHGSTAVYFF